MAVVQQIGKAGMRASANVSALTFDANGNYLSGGIQQGICVIQDIPDGNPLSVTIAGVGAQILGVADTTPAAGTGMSLDVIFLGIVRVQASAAVTIGQIVYVANASGQVGPIPADGAVSVYTVGQALEAAAQAGDLITVMLQVSSQHVIS